MRLLSELFARIRSLVFARREDRELDEEIRFHLEREIEKNLGNGLRPREARRQAHIKFGGVERMRERTREARGVGWIETPMQDLRYARRQLWRHRSFSAVAALTMAVGIGANASIFAVFRAVLFEPLPYADASRVVVVRERSADDPASQVAPGTFLDWRERTSTLTGLSAYQVSTPILVGDGDAEAVPGARITADLFPMLGVTPEAGRVILPEETEYGREGVVVLSHALWMRRFDGDRSILGRTIDLSGRSHTVVGVMPEGFVFPDGSAELWTPMVFVGARNPDNRQFRFLNVVGRLAPGVGLEQARAELTSVSAALAEEYPQAKAGWGARVDPMLEAQVAAARPALVVLLTSVGLLMLIAMANVAALFLVRAGSRTQEVATRLALGAGRGRIARQLTTEGVLVAALGGATGLVLAAWVIEILPGHLGDTPRVDQLHLDPRVVGLALALSAVAGAVFGLTPLLHLSATRLRDALERSGRIVSDGVGGRRLRSALVGGQIALSVVLLVCSGLLGRSMASRARIDPGFSPDGAFRAVVTFPPYATSEERLPAYRNILRVLRETPGIEVAGTVNVLPAAGSELPTPFSIGDAPPTGPDAPTASEYQVMPGYFAAMGIQLRSGRSFTDLDAEDAPEVVIVNETLARSHFGATDVVGRSIRLANSEANQAREIVGVVGDVRTGTLTEEPPPQVYLPFPQLDNPVGGLVVVVRGSGSAVNPAEAIRRAVRETRPDLAVSPARPLAVDIADALARERLVTLVLAIFAALALGLAVLGIYGVVAYAATQRAHEMGVRMMLGAEPGDVLRLVVGLGARLAVLGVSAGVLAALVATRLLGSLLYGVGAVDPVTFVTVPAVMICIALVAAYVPARSVAASDPLKRLRRGA